MNNLWNKEFRPFVVETPKDIIDDQCDYLKTMTNGKVIARVREFKENVDFTNVPRQTIKVPIMSKNTSLKKLGDTEGSCFTYEFFITSKYSTAYKYRVMFIQYGIELYPVNILLDGAIANEVALDTHFICLDSDDFKASLYKILNSNKIEKVINGLLSIVRKETDPQF